MELHSKKVRYWKSNLADFMIPLDDLVTSNKDRCFKFYEQLATVPTDANVVKVFGNSYNEEVEKTKELSNMITVCDACTVNG